MSRIFTMRALARSVSTLAVVTSMGVAAAASAQTAPAAAADQSAPEIIVTGVRASLDRSISLKRNSSGVVDGISAEDIGKFPATNVAESLQRITGVSIDRVNGEGSRVTVRGFGPGFNLVTLNGRSVPTASLLVVGQDQGGDFATGTGRSFDFSNLAAEGVKTLEVYKTSRAAVGGGGIGAAINVVTRKPLEGKTGLTGSIGAKANYDSTSTDWARVTPELSGALNYKNDEGTFGVALFASYQKRNNSSVSVTVNDWNIVPYSTFNAPGTSPFVKSDGTTVINNAPTSGSTLVAVPNDVRYNYSQFQRERLNTALSLQFKPSDRLEISVDGVYVVNKNKENRTDQTNWYNRPFSSITFDGNKQVATAIALTDIITGTKDGGFEQQARATKSDLWSIGANVKFHATDKLTLSLDGQVSEARALPNNALGASSTLFSMAYKAVAGQSLKIVDGFPQQSVVFNDALPGTGNANGKLDYADLGSQVARNVYSSQRMRTKELRFDGSYELGDGNRVEFGANWRESNMSQASRDTYQALGDWGVGRVGDIQQYAPNALKQFSLTGLFNHFNTGATGASTTAFRGDATELYNLVATKYPGLGNLSGSSDNKVKESVLAAYAQLNANLTLAGMPANIVAGLRYERTRSTSTSLVQIPTAIVWTADNDFTRNIGSAFQPVVGKGSYENFLPALDFSIDLTSKVKGRLSYGRTMARPDFGLLFSGANAGTPNRPTLLGGIPGGSSGNPNLQPLISDNVDLSLEWYPTKHAYFSVGLFDKRVKNFVGTGQETQNLYGLRDATSGAAGSRSGDAQAYLKSIGADLSDVNLFTMTALIDNFGLTSAKTQFSANYSGGALSQAYIDQILTAYNVTPNSADPLMQFQVQKPVNNKEGHIYGAEIAGQYFLGETGLGLSAAYTIVRGDVAYDITASPSSDQFALLGLSDTANVSAIFEKYGVSARLTYNWRDSFLSNNSRGGYRNPVFVAPYGQFDLNLSYDITPKIAVSFEAINLTKADVKTYARTTNQPWFIVQGASRYLVGARYKF